MAASSAFAGSPALAGNGCEGNITSCPAGFTDVARVNVKAAPYYTCDDIAPAKSGSASSAAINAVKPGATTDISHIVLCGGTQPTCAAAPTRSVTGTLMCSAGWSVTFTNFGADWYFVRIDGEQVAEGVTSFDPQTIYGPTVPADRPPTRARRMPCCRQSPSPIASRTPPRPRARRSAVPSADDAATFCACARPRQ